MELQEEPDSRVLPRVGFFRSRAKLVTHTARIGRGGVTTTINKTVKKQTQYMMMNQQQESRLGTGYTTPKKLLQLIS